MLILKSQTQTYRRVLQVQLRASMVHINQSFSPLNESFTIISVVKISYKSNEGKWESFFTRTEEQKQLLATFRAGGLNEHL